MTRANERGFTLVEVVVCAALVVAAGAATLGAVAATARPLAETTNRARAAALVRNALVRARAAAAYAPASPAYDPATYTASRGWALRSAGTTVALPADPADGACGRLIVRLDVTYSDGPPPSVTATATYPRSACVAGATATVTAAEALAPPLAVPGSEVHRTIADPRTHR